MRMFRFSSWITESKGCDEVVNGGPDIMADALPSMPPVININLGKRKWEADMDESSHLQVAQPDVKRKMVEESAWNGVEKQPQMDPCPVIDAKNVQRNGKSSRRIREIIDSQLGLEVLLKHDEIRLINQELARCQTALEQLKRCHLMPYPGAEGLSQAVTNGTGPSVAVQPHVKPMWAAPYGVTEGPYSRHYSKWLIPDPSFDGVYDSERSTDRQRSGKFIEGRTTRHGFTDGSTPSGKPRTHRGSAGQKLQALSSGYAQPKEKHGPSILKRADGQMVKLVCIDCRREDFSSVQGFINHCRIAHRREFKSHEEAGSQSGQPIELDEIGGIVGEEKSIPIPTGLVHPMIRSTPTDKESYNALLMRISDSLDMFHQGKLPGVTCIPTSASRSRAATSPSSKNFVPSNDTPHLSALLRSRGFGVNLCALVDDAKTLDVDEASSHSEDSDMDVREPTSTTAHRAPANFSLDGADDSHVSAIRTIARPTKAPAPFKRPSSSKGPEAHPTRKPGVSPRLAYATPIDTSAANRNAGLMSLDSLHHTVNHSTDSDEDSTMLDSHHAINLSPNTVASNNAPSLVSDDGEYDDDEADDGAESDTSMEAEEANDIAEVEIEDVDAVERARKGSGEGVRLRGKEDKHVTFVSPVKESKAARSA